MIVDLAAGHMRVCSDNDGRTDPGAEYGPAGGYSPLREAIAAWMDVTTDRVALTTGASLGLAATLATLERPCSVLCPRPYYPLYPRLTRLLGITPIFYDLDPSQGCRPDPDQLSDLARSDTRAFLWNVPGNPVGGLPTAGLIERMAELVERLDLLVVSDEVYADFVYDGLAVPDLSRGLGERRVVRVRSFSKLLSMPGERLGFVLAHPDRLAAICHAHWTLALSPPASAQAAALCGLRANITKQVDEQRKILSANRDCIVRILSRCPTLTFSRPSAGIFLWIGAETSCLDSRALARACADRAGVAVCPGSAFGVDAPPYFRVCFAVPPDQARRGARALAGFFGSSGCVALTR